MGNDDDDDYVKPSLSGKGPKKLVPCVMAMISLFMGAFCYLRAVLPEDHEMILFDYLQMQTGSRFHVRLEDHPDETRGIIAQKNFAVGEKILHIPKKYIYTFKNSPKQLRDLFAKQQFNGWRLLVIACGLIYEKYHGDSSDSLQGWRTELRGKSKTESYVDVFLNSLPKAEHLNNINKYEQRHLNALYGPLEWFRGTQSSLLHAVNHLAGHLSALLENNQEAILREVRWAHGIMFSHSFQINDEHPAVVIPIMNHVRYTWDPEEANVRNPTCDARGCTLVATRLIKKDEFIVMHTGPHSNFQFMTRYGNYMNGGNPFAEALNDDLKFGTWLDKYNCFTMQQSANFIPVLQKSLPTAYTFASLDTAFRCRTLNAYGEAKAAVAVKVGHHKTFTLERVRVTPQGKQFWKEDVEVASTISALCRGRLTDVKGRIGNLTAADEDIDENIQKQGIMPSDGPGHGFSSKIVFALSHERQRLEKCVALMENIVRNLNHGYESMPDPEEETEEETASSDVEDVEDEEDASEEL